MHQLQRKHAREEVVQASASHEAMSMSMESVKTKRWRTEVDGDVVDGEAIVVPPTETTAIKWLQEGEQVDQQEQQQQQQQQQQSVNGISPDAKDKDEGDCNDAGDDDAGEEELVLFAGPEHALDKSSIDVRSACHGSRNSRPASARRRGGGPDVQGAVTTLHSLQQLEMVFGTCPTPASDAAAARAPSSTSPLLQLLPGETVMVVLHHGQAHVRELLRPETRELSMTRIFCLDLGALPASEYDGDTVSASMQGGDDGDSAFLNSLRLPDVDNMTSFSSQIAHGTEHVMQRVCALLRLDDLLNRNDSVQAVPTPTSVHGNASNNNKNNNGHSSSQVTLPETQRSGRREELVLPAMVMWHAEGGPADEYNSSDKNTSSQVVSPSCAAHGGPLVVKQLTSVDQLHSLSLLMPVYTLEHLLRTVARTAIFSAHAATASLGSRTLIYFGASWCPPCMRIVNVLPEMMKNDFPTNLTCAVKADMDLATPVFEFFGVEIIPTFVMLDNDILRQAGDWDTLCNSHAAPECLQQLREGLRRSVLGRIQNSQRLVVRSFIERYSCELKFDEDF